MPAAPTWMRFGEGINKGKPSPRKWEKAASNPCLDDSVRQPSPRHQACTSPSLLVLWRWWQFGYPLWEFSVSFLLSPLWAHGFCRFVWPSRFRCWQPFTHCCGENPTFFLLASPGDIESLYYPLQCLSPPSVASTHGQLFGGPLSLSSSGVGRRRGRRQQALSYSHPFGLGSGDSSKRFRHCDGRRGCGATCWCWYVG